MAQPTEYRLETLTDFTNDLMDVFEEDRLTDPSLKQIVRHFFGHVHDDEYCEYRFIQNPDNPAKPFEFGPILTCDRQVFWLLGNAILPLRSVELHNFRTAFPQYNGRELILIYMSTVIQPDQVRYLTNQGIYAMALGEENMELLNFDELLDR